MEDVRHAKHSFGKCDRRTDRRKTDKVIPMCRYASQATQKPDAPDGNRQNMAKI